MADRALTDLGETLSAGASPVAASPSATGSSALPLRDRILAWWDRTVSTPGFQSWAARFPLTRPVARHRSRALFDVMAGFVYSQVLRACVELDVFALVAIAPLTVAELAQRTGVPADALDRLIRAAIALRLLETRSRGRIGLGALGAPLANNEGLRALVDHHALLYDDLRHPVGLLRAHAAADTELGRYYPYAADGSSPVPREVASYSALMSATAAPIIAEVLDAVPFSSCGRVLDVGGGEGRFARALAERWPHLEVGLFDLPSVAARAVEISGRTGPKILVEGGDFRADEIPGKWDVITLLRILLDHGDATVLQLLKRAHQALSPGGRVLIAEPMAGVRGAEKVGDAYFGFYLFAMGNGRARRQSELTEMCLSAGFRKCRAIPTRYPVSTGILIAEA